LNEQYILIVTNELFKTFKWIIYELRIQWQ